VSFTGNQMMAQALQPVEMQAKARGYSKHSRIKIDYKQAGNMVKTIIGVGVGAVAGLLIGYYSRCLGGPV
jgi:hypothetical protein